MQYRLAASLLFLSIGCSSGADPSGVEPVGTTSQAIQSPGPLFTVVGQTDTGSLPPDTNGAVSSSFIVTTVNDFLNIKDRRGNVLLSEDQNSVFWASLNPGITTDSRARFDPYTQHFIITAESNVENPSNSRILIAISKTADPTAGFNLFSIPADPNQQHSIDFPAVGYNKNWIVITAQVEAINGATDSFQGVWVIDKASLLAGGPPRFTFFNEGLGSPIAPAETYDPNAEEMWMLRQLEDGSVLLLELIGPVGAEAINAVSAVAPPLPTAPTSTLFTLPQAGGTPTNFLVSGGANLESDCIFRNGSIWGVEQVVPVDSPTRTAVQWLQISATTGSLQSSGRIDDPTGNSDPIKASIAVNKNNDFLIGYTRFSPNSFPSAAYALHAASDPAGTIRDPVVYLAGQSPYFNTRWGDYSYTQIDPLNDSDFWTVQEAASNVTSSWVTFWADVAAPAAPFVYFRSNATAWGVDESTRLQAFPAPNVFGLVYNVTQQYMVSSGDSAIVTETNQLDGWGTNPLFFSTNPSQFTVPATEPLVSGTNNFTVKYPALGQYRILVNVSNGSINIDSAADACAGVCPSGRTCTLTHAGVPTCQ
jgi:hypothetical protein